MILEGWAWLLIMAAFSGAARSRLIRSKMLQDDLIDCIILLPEKLFYNTGAPGALVFLNKNKPVERKGKVLFINASSEFEQHPEVRKLNRLSEVNIQRIAEAYRKFDGGDGFVRAVPLDEIKNNDYNLNVTLYVFPQEEAEKIDVEREWQELRIIEGEIAGVDAKIEGYLKEIMAK
jgi:type I restriction enzyme M protein